MAKCIDCDNMDLSDRNKYEEAYCSVRGRYYDPYSGICNSYKDKNESRYIRNRENKYESDNYHGQGESACYITTTVCNVLKLEDDCEILNILRTFRDEYMMRNAKYIPLLIEYAVLGSLISEQILKEQDCMIFARNLLKSYLLEAIKYINLQEYEKAVSIYTEMITYLKDRYNMKDVFVNMEGIDAGQLVQDGIDKDGIKRISKTLVIQKKQA